MNQPTTYKRKETVLSVGAIPQLLALREAVLGSAGCDVFTTTDPQEAAEKIAGGRCGVLLICYSTPPEWQHKLIDEFRAACPKGRIVAITNHPVPEHRTQVDCLIYGLDGPEFLIDAVLGKKAA